MKKLFILIVAASVSLVSFSQKRVIVPENLRDVQKRKGSLNITAAQGQKNVPVVSANAKSSMEGIEAIGGTRYDLQTNSSVQNRFHIYEDGTKAAVWTMGLIDPGFLDRGTGYTYFDGNNWGANPTVSIESVRTGWPSYAPYGENGELVVSHDFSLGTLIMLSRDQKGTGTWTESEFVGPDSQKISWNRTTTAGTNNSVIHMLYLTFPSGNSGTVYQGLDGALLYSRTTDGGTTWEVTHEILEGMTSDDYFGFRADNYEWAAYDEDNIALLVGGYWIDMFLMKSDDGGESWAKTIIWEHPYPFFNTVSTFITDTLYCNDGTHHLAYDSQGKVHVVFGVCRTVADDAGWYYYPFVDGIGYWNEDMPTFSNDINALNPYGHPDSELTEDYNLIGWTQDMDGDGEITFIGETTENIGNYGIGLSSQPQMLIDDLDRIFVIWSGVTETFETSTQNFRHLWGRGFGNGEWGDFYHITNNITFSFTECVFPTITNNDIDNQIHFTFQSDYEPGMHVQGDVDEAADNTINYMSVEKGHFITVGIQDNQTLFNTIDVSQNSPNPFSGRSYLNVHLEKACNLSMEITNVTGQLVFTSPVRFVNAGSFRLEIDATDFKPGIYFYTVRADGAEVTKKMMVE